MYEVHTDMAPQYLKNILLPTSKRYLLPVVNLDLYKSSFAYFGPTVWNSLPALVTESSSLQSLKLRARQYLLSD